jgi:hypothetical protein
VRDRVVAEPQLGDRVRVAVEREDAAGIESTPREQIVDVLPVPVSIELDRDTAPGRLLEHDVPIR